MFTLGLTDAEQGFEGAAAASMLQQAGREGARAGRAIRGANATGGQMSKIRAGLERRG